MVVVYVKEWGVNFMCVIMLVIRVSLVMNFWRLSFVLMLSFVMLIILIIRMILWFGRRFFLFRLCWRSVVVLLLIVRFVFVCFFILLIWWRIGVINCCYKYWVKLLIYGYLELFDGVVCWKFVFLFFIFYLSVGGFMLMECFVIDDVMFLYFYIIW